MTTEYKICSRCGAHYEAHRSWLVSGTVPREVCSLGCALNGDDPTTLEIKHFGTHAIVREEPEPKDERALIVPDIYLAEVVGLIRNALNKWQTTGPTERILDHWCDEQEEYLEAKYPTEPKSGVVPSAISHFTIGGVLGSKSRPVMLHAKVQEQIVNELLGSAGIRSSREPKEPDIPTYVWDEIDERIADRLMKENNRRHTSVTFSPPDGSEPQEVLRVSHDEAQRMTQEDWDAIKERIAKGGLLWTSEVFPRQYPVDPSTRHNRDGITTRLSVNVDGPINSTMSAEECLGLIEPPLDKIPDTPRCFCSQFQGSNPACPQHGKGSAWHDLHGSE